jgi:hypothetical protein
VISQSAPKIDCINCGEPVSSAFCSHCGQKRVVSRINWPSLWENTYRLFGFDTRILRTFRDMTIRPYKVCRQYLNGNRTLYMEPVGFYMLCTTILFLLMSLMDVDIREMIESSQKSINQATAMSKNQSDFSQSILNFITSNYRLFSAFLIPLNAIGTWLLFLKGPYNYLEHLVINLYASGWLVITTLVGMIYFVLTANIPPSFHSIVAFFFYGFIFSRLIEGKKWKLFLRGAFGYLLGLVFLFLGFGLFAVAYVLLFTKV